MLNNMHNLYLKVKNQLRIKVVKLLGANIGRNVKSFGRFTVINHQLLSIGDGSTLNEGVIINCRDRVSIGKGVRISSNVQIHSAKLIINSVPRVHYKEKIIINDNVWIASGSVISAGVTIGKNSVIGANSVVISDVEENSFYAGNPAKKVKCI